MQTILAFAYTVTERRLVGPEDLLAMRYDFCVLLPRGASGDVDMLRDMLERTLRLKIRREERETDVFVLKLAGGSARRITER